MEGGDWGVSGAWGWVLVCRRLGVDGGIELEAFAVPVPVPVPVVSDASVFVSFVPDVLEGVVVAVVSTAALP